KAHGPSARPVDRVLRQQGDGRDLDTPASMPLPEPLQERVAGRFGGGQVTDDDVGGEGGASGGGGVGGGGERPGELRPIPEDVALVIVVVDDQDVDSLELFPRYIPHADTLERRHRVMTSVTSRSLANSVAGLDGPRAAGPEWPTIQPSVRSGVGSGSWAPN